VLLVGGGTAAILALSDELDDEEVVAAPAWSAPSGEESTFRSSRLGYTVALPPGLTMHEDETTGGSLAQGTYAGNVLSIAVAPVAGYADAESRAQQIVQATGGAAALLERRTRRIRGEDVVSIVYDVAAAGSRFETVFYPGTTPLAVTFAAQLSYFDETAALRDSLFRDRFQPGD
jgi:hypothetical protein